MQYLSGRQHSFLPNEYKSEFSVKRNDFPILTYLYIILFQTFNADAQIGESSACATALMCGVKTNFETVGLDARGRFENCYSSFTSRVTSLIDWAQQAG